LDDQPALRAAAAEGGPIVPLFIWTQDEESPWAPGAASRWWLHQSLSSLQAQLRNCGSRLILRRGPTAETLLALVKETGAARVFWNRRYEPAVRKRDEQVEAALQSAGVKVQTFPDRLLFDLDKIRTSSGQPFQVFTPFWKACLDSTASQEWQPAPARLPAPTEWPISLELVDLQLEPTIDWDAGVRSAWQPGSDGAQTQLKRFAQHGVRGYAVMRDRPDEVSTSQLSPHLHFGEISPRRAWQTTVEAASGKSTGPIPIAAEPFLRQLGWREFAHYLLYHFPQTQLEPLRRDFADFPWHDDPQSLRQWQRGQTGYPLVDAGMRQLWATGWMHNRVRMVVASFLVKHLLVSWLEGARWFWDTLVDADLANNTLGWQWTAGCGADAAPFFRIFNPVVQGEKFDPQGNYVRRWVPELKNLSGNWIHKPWEAPPDVLAAAGVELGKTYPRPMVEHAVARQRALDALKNNRGASRASASE
jgi:deoxyribodipyrimidine photo-lyase